MFERVMLRIGAVSFVAGLVAAVVFELLHPHRQDPNNNPLVFTEYAHAGDWITVHLVDQDVVAAADLGPPDVRQGIGHSARPRCRGQPVRN
jgi:hypothetical protein